MPRVVPLRLAAASTVPTDPGRNQRAESPIAINPEGRK